MRLLLGLLLAAFSAPQPGGSQEPPARVREVLIGYFGPDDPNHPVGGALWQGTSLAIEEANREGGYQGTPFRLVQGWDENPWSGGAATVVRMAYEQRVSAIIGGIDGTSTHLAEQVVAKARLTLIDPASTDRTVNAANVEWTFSCMPADPPLMAAVGEALLASPGGESYILVSATDHDSRIMTEEFTSFVGSKRKRPRRHLQFQSGSYRIPEVAAQIGESGAKAVIILAGASDSAAMVRELRKHDTKMAIFGGPSMGRRTFIARAGPAAEGVRFPFALNSSQSAPEFANRFRSRYGEAPDYASFHAYDAARLLVAAIRKAGLDRTRIRDAVEELSPWEGTAGTIRWDELGRNLRSVQLATVINAQVRRLPR